MKIEHLIRVVLLRLRSMFRRSQVEQELSEEIRFHIERRTEELIASGLPPDHARQEAIRAFNGVEQRKEECRDARGTRLIENIGRDFRQGLRSLRKNPGFTIVAVLTLALGIGANTTLFTLLDPILFRPLPYRDPERLVRVLRTSPQSKSWPHSPPNFLDYRAQNDAFIDLAAFTWTSFNLSDPGELAERAQGLTVSAAFFPLLGVQPELGRVFTQEEDGPGALRVIVLSHRYWMGRFGGDREIIGRTLRFNGQDTKIVGVMPDSFEGAILFGRIDVWAPLALTETQRQNRNTNYLSIVGRLKPGISREEANARIVALAARLQKEHAEDNRGESVRVEDFKRSITQDTVKQLSWFTFALTTFVLLIACVNLANLQLARTTTRAREFAMRAALGCSRTRLLSQSLTESLLVALIGAAVALPASIGGAQVVAARAFSEIPGAHMTFDYRFFAFAFSCSVLAGIVCGIVPAGLAARADLNQLLKDNPRTGTSSRSQHRLRQALIVVEVAFALVLLAGTGVFVRGLKQVTEVNPGWRVDGVLIGRIGLDGPNYARPPQAFAFLRTLQQRLNALPGVQNAALSSSSPTWIFDSNTNVIIEGRPNDRLLLNVEAISTRYFETLSIPVKEGRTFTDDDRFGRPPVAIINETMATRYWPGESPLGKRLLFAGDTQMRWMEIVGVVGDVKFPSALINGDSDLTFYRPIAQNVIWGARLEIRTAGSPEALIPAVRQLAAELDKDQPIFDLRSVRSLIHQNVAGLDLVGTLLTAFSVLGLLLAAVGIFGVISYSVTQRTNEIGIRIALGAEGRQVLLLTLKQGLGITLAGTFFGFLGAAGVVRVLATSVPGLPAGDAVTLLSMTGVLLVVALLACYFPARRASKVDPMVALRHE